MSVRTAVALPALQVAGWATCFVVWRALGDNAWYWAQVGGGLASGALLTGLHAVRRWRRRDPIWTVQALVPRRPASELDTYLRSGRLPQSAEAIAALAPRITEELPQIQQSRTGTVLVGALGVSLLVYAGVAGGGVRLQAALILTAPCVYSLVNKQVRHRRLARLQRQLARFTGHVPQTRR